MPKILQIAGTEWGPKSETEYAIEMDETIIPKDVKIEIKVIDKSSLFKRESQWEEWEDYRLPGVSRIIENRKERWGSGAQGNPQEDGAIEEIMEGVERKCELCKWDGWQEEKSEMDSEDGCGRYPNRKRNRWDGTNQCKRIIQRHHIPMIKVWIIFLMYRLIIFNDIPRHPSNKDRDQAHREKSKGGNTQDLEWRN